MDVEQVELSNPVIVLEKGKTARWTYINALSDMCQLATGVDLHNHRKSYRRRLASPATLP